VIISPRTQNFQNVPYLKRRHCWMKILRWNFLKKFYWLAQQ
jgi:hypothetical protein